MTYPEARIEEVQDTLAGVSFRDPYRWLEGDTEETRQWQLAQADLASSHVREWPHLDRLREIVRRFNTPTYISLPRYAAGQWFSIRPLAGTSRALAMIADEPMGQGRVLFNSATDDSRPMPFLSWVAPSPDGRTLAVGVCGDGSERNTIRLIDVATGELLNDPPQQTLMDASMGGVQWLPDSSGFFLCALQGAPREFSQQIYLHRRAPVPTTVATEIPWTTARDWRMVFVSRDGRYAVAVERLMNPIPVAIATLERDSLQWRSFVTSIQGTLAGHVMGDQYIAVTDIGGARGRLIAIPLNAPDPNDPATWRELLPESAAVLRTVTPVGEALYLTEFVDTYARVRIVDTTGKELGQLPLPGRGAICEEPFPITNLVPKGHPERFIFGFSSFTTSPAIYSHAPGQPLLETLQESDALLENALVEDRWAISKDGTRVPYHIVRSERSSATEPQGTLIYAYGGFNVPSVPRFPGPMAAFVVAGGVFVHAHLRGGAEFGRAWWEGGRMHNKQNCYEDLYAVAEDLIAARRCVPQSLALTGRSNGGLMAAVAATQRPDLWKVVVPRVPLTDLIGACREPYGRMAVTMEYANIEDPDEVRRLATFSPYQLVREGISYPAIFIDAGNTDPRCPPWHARKFAARLQATTLGTAAPVLLHVWPNAGHGRATDQVIEVDEYSEWLAFTLRHLDIHGVPDGL